MSALTETRAAASSSQPLRQQIKTRRQVMAGASLPIKRWWIILPIAFITYSLAYVDRTNYGFAAAAGIDRDLGISHSTSSMIGSLFFLGYFFFQIPGGIYAERRSVRRLIFFSLIAWGGLAAMTGVVTS